MNVLHVNSNYLTSKLHENLIDKIESDDLHNTIFMPIKSETKDNFLYKSKHDVSFPVTFKNVDKFFFSYKQNKMYKKLHEMNNLSEFNVTHAHTLFTDGNIALNLLKDYGIPYVVTVRGATDIEIFFKIRLNLRKKGREILQKANKVVFLSESNRQELLTKYINNDSLKNNISNKSVILPNGIDDFWFENEWYPKKINKDKPLRIIYVGKTMKLKNLSGTVQALNYLKNEKGIDSIYTSVGKVLEGSYADKIANEAEIEYKNITNTPREELITYYRQNDIFVMPSFSETFGLVYPEAMSQGLPVIYTQNQGFDGQFEEGVVGYAVDADAPQDIAKKIQMIVDNYEDMSKNALEAYKKFNWNKISQYYSDIYKKNGASN